MKNWRSIAAPAILSSVTFLAAGAAEAQTCNPGIGAAYVSHKPQYDKVLAALVPELVNLNTELDAIGSGATFAANQALYAALVTRARSIVTAINTPTAAGGRVLMTPTRMARRWWTPPRWTIRVATRPLLPARGGTASPCRRRPGARAPVRRTRTVICSRRASTRITDSRIAIFDAQEWPCGFRSRDEIQQLDQSG